MKDDKEALEGSRAADGQEPANQPKVAQEPPDGHQRANLARKVVDMTAYIETLQMRYKESLNKANSLLGTIEQIRVERDKLQRLLDHDMQAGPRG